MSVLFCSEVEDPAPWRVALGAAFPGMPFRVWPDPGAREAVRYVLAWRPPAGSLAGLPNLRAVLVLGAGVDSVLSDPALPAQVPVLRLVDAGFPAQMAEYAAYAVLRYQHRMAELEALQREARWQQLDPYFARDLPVGVMGLGVIGRVVAQRIAALGFQVAGWARSPKQIDGVELFIGPSRLQTFLARSRVVVNVLPLTPQTHNILDAGLFAAMPRGGYLVNIGRRGHLDESALIEALDAGQLEGAMLDVFREEPLPPTHPFWRHPKIVVTPHVAGPTIVSEVQAQVIDNIRRMERGEAPHGLVDRARGY